MRDKYRNKKPTKEQRIKGFCSSIVKEITDRSIDFEFLQYEAISYVYQVLLSDSNDNHERICNQLWNVYFDEVKQYIQRFNDERKDL